MVWHSLVQFRLWENAGQVEWEFQPSGELTRFVLTYKLEGEIYRYGKQNGFNVSVADGAVRSLLFVGRVVFVRSGDDEGQYSVDVGMPVEWDAEGGDRVVMWNVTNVGDDVHISAQFPQVCCYGIWFVRLTFFGARAQPAGVAPPGGRSLHRLWDLWHFSAVSVSQIFGA